MSDHPQAIGKVAAEKFDCTRQAIHKHIQHLVKEGAIRVSGSTRNKRYSLAQLAEYRLSYELRRGLAEDVVWQNQIVPILGLMAENARRIWAYGFTKMLNNAIDYSSGTHITIHIIKTAADTEISISDDGVGIFKKIQHAFDLVDERHSVLELAKGKLTTDPSRHSGQGIFFSSRMFDIFSILSGKVYFSHKFGKKED